MKKSVAMVLSIIIVLYSFSLVANAQETELVITFSHDSGFYDSEFDLTMQAPKGCSIYYTLDGSTPTEKSIKYDDKIHIYDRTNDANIPLVDAFINNKNINPSYKYDKITTLKAIAVGADGEASDVFTKTYFIGFNNKEDYYKNMKIISLTTDKENLFGYEKGIYVLGKTYGDWKKSPEYSPSLLVMDEPANYKNRGREWERVAHISIFEDGKEQYEDNIGLRTHGGSTRSYEQKPFNVYARKEYSHHGKGKIDYQLFDNELTDFDTVTLRNGGNDYKYTKIRDKLIQTLVSDRAVLTQQMTPCVLFINGEYWGLYEIIEKISKDYIKQHYPEVKKDNVVIIKAGNLEEGTEEDYDSYTQFCTYVNNTDFTVEENYNELRSKLDIQSFIDYMSVEIYIANIDWGENIAGRINRNTALWKVNKLKDADYCDGKYRFILFDTEVSTNLFFNIYQNINNFHKVMIDRSLANVLFNKLMMRKSFRDEFKATFIEIAENNFSVDKVNKLIDEYVPLYRSATCDTIMRFDMSTKSKEKLLDRYDSYIDGLKTFFSQRKDYIMRYLENYLAGISKLNYNESVNTVTAKYGGVPKQPEADVQYRDNTNTEIAMVKRTGVENNSETAKVTPKITKVANTAKISIKTKKYRVRKLKRKSKTFLIKVKNAKGKVVYFSNDPQVIVTDKGKVTVKKGTKKGIYKIKLKVKGNKNYKAKTFTVKVKVI